MCFRLTSAFDENRLNKSRFVSLLDTFLDEETQNETVEDLVNFIHGGYVETEEEKMERLAKVGAIKRNFQLYMCVQFPHTKMRKNHCIVLLTINSIS